MFVQMHTRPVDLANEWPADVDTVRASWTKIVTKKPAPVVLAPRQDAQELARLEFKPAA